MTHTPASLIAFRDRVAAAFRDKRIRSPVHFPSDTQAVPLCRIFADFRPGTDWLFSQWRNMWHCLLAGMPEDELFEQILEGRSMYVMSRERRILCSSIVGGHLPLALGVAWAIDERGGREKVWVCVGDTTARTGLFHEFQQFAFGHNLPIRVVVEDNGLSTNTPTGVVWGTTKNSDRLEWRRYTYDRTHPHVGLSERVNF